MAQQKKAKEVKKRWGRPASAAGVYSGQVAADGEGNLIAEEGDQAGEFIVWAEDNDSEEGHYEYVMKGEQSHNERYHQQFAGLEIGGEGSLETGEE